MTWRCALLQPKLPAYPDGDLSPFWRRLIEAHLKVCPDCRRELEELTEAVSHYQSQPLPDPGEAFWQEFERELHLKLVQVNQEPEPRRQRLRLPHYVLGATALAGVLALAVYLGPLAEKPSPPGMVQAPAESKTREMVLHQKAPRAPKVPAVASAPSSREASKSLAVDPADIREASPLKAAKPESPSAAEGQVNLAAGSFPAEDLAEKDDDDLLADEDILSWDMDSLVVDLSREEQQNLKARLESRR